MVGSRLVLNGLIFADDIPVDIQLVTFLFLSNISELSIGPKTKIIIITCKKCFLPNKKSYPFLGICSTSFVRSVSFFSVSTCFSIFELIFLFKFLSLSSNSVFSTKSSISYFLILILQ